MRQNTRARIQLSLTEVFYNCCFASANFLSVFLQSLGIGAGQIGLITALTNGMNIVSQPFWGAVSDRIRSVRRSFVLCIGLSGICALGIPLLARHGSASLLPMTVLLVFLYFFIMPANMLVEMWLVRVNANPRLQISYGSVRIWASIGFALMNLAYVPLLRRLPVRSVYYFYAAFALCAALAAFSVPEGAEVRSQQDAPRVRFRDMQFRKILTYGVVSYLVFEILFQIPFGWSNSYTVYILNEFGLESTSFGAFTFLSGIFEVPMLLLCKRLIRRRGLAAMLAASSMLFVAQYALYAFGHALFTLVLCQAFKGFAYAIYVTCRHQYVYEIAPKGLEGSTQAVVNAAYAGVNILSAALGGYLLQGIGVRSFFAINAGIQLLAGLFLLGSRRIGDHRASRKDVKFNRR